MKARRVFWFVAAIVVCAGVTLGVDFPVGNASPATPSGGFTQLNGVVCTSAADCWAVGSKGNANAGLLRSGGSWAPHPVAQPGGRPRLLRAIACVTTSDCWAVGQDKNTAGAVLNQAQHWDGSAWHTVSTPNPGGTRNQEINGLHGIACTSSSDCWAVGRGGDHRVILHWKGTKWTVATVPPIGVSFLNGVTCITSNDCWAVGQAGATRTLSNATLHWDGTSWTAVPAPDPSGEPTAALEAVSCVSSTDCWAVGGTPKANEALQWNGHHWSVVTVPRPTNAAWSSLYTVTCTVANDCWALGGYKRNQQLREQALHWNGSQWVSVAMPNPLPANFVNGVSCMSSTSCWAVGTAILHSNGAKWTVSRLP